MPTGSDEGDDNQAVDMDQDNTPGDVEMDFVGCVTSEQGIGSLEPSTEDHIAQLLLAEMGSSGRVRQRDGRKASKKMVSGIYIRLHE